jgi:CheY-like chemotaxis protein
MRLRCVLVADDSEVVCALLTALLSPHAQEVRTARSVAEALHQLEDAPHLDLVVCDVLFPDGHGLQVLDRARRGRPDAPPVILMTARPDGADAALADAAGALGYLAKPIQMAEIRRLWRLSQSERWRDRAPRRRCGAAVVIQESCDSKEQVLECRAVNLSRTGALLETGGPLPIGTELDLVLDPGGTAVPLRGRVVRIQEPSWDHAAGVAVQFLDPSAEIQRSVDELCGDG